MKLHLLATDCGIPQDNWVVVGVAPFAHILIEPSRVRTLPRDHTCIFEHLRHNTTIILFLDQLHPGAPVFEQQLHGIVSRLWSGLAQLELVTVRSVLQITDGLIQRVLSKPDKAIVLDTSKYFFLHKILVIFVVFRHMFKCGVTLSCHGCLSHAKLTRVRHKTHTVSVSQAKNLATCLVPSLAGGWHGIFRNNPAKLVTQLWDRMLGKNVFHLPLFSRP